MSMTLRKVLQSPTTKIKKLNDSNRGSTYLQIKCLKAHIPKSCKEEWGCVWSSIHKIIKHRHILYDLLTEQVFGGQETMDNADYRIIEMVFHEEPTVFLRDIIKAKHKHETKLT